MDSRSGPPASMAPSALIFTWYGRSLVRNTRGSRSCSCRNICPNTDHAPSWSGVPRAAPRVAFMRSSSTVTPPAPPVSSASTCSHSCDLTGHITSRDMRAYLAASDHGLDACARSSSGSSSCTIAFTSCSTATRARTRLSCTPCSAGQCLVASAGSVRSFTCTPSGSNDPSFSATRFSTSTSCSSASDDQRRPRRTNGSVCALCLASSAAQPSSVQLGTADRSRRSWLSARTSSGATSSSSPPSSSVAFPSSPAPAPAAAPAPAHAAAAEAFDSASSGASVTAARSGALAPPASRRSTCVNGSPVIKNEQPEPATTPSTGARVSSSST
mmetsp:Transcript_20355/g.65085  ORF Transcript_20355/g.65085 Transcript_20355/m.65085 type:complete len:328 (-) Transcript_20355:893-1876(-)